MDKDKQKEFCLMYEAIEKVWNTINRAPWNNNFEDLNKDEREFIRKKYKEAQRLNNKPIKQDRDFVEMRQIRKEIRDKVKSNTTISPLEEIIDSTLNLW